MKPLLPLLWILLAAFSATAFAQDRPYTEGQVTVVTSVRVAPGQEDRYIAYLQSAWKASMEEQKKAGIILGYAVHEVTPRRLDDPNMYLVVTYPNMASFDGLDDRVDPITAKATGMNREQAAQAMADRGSMRTILGSQMLRQLVLK